jgi:hypothetical protein
MAISSGLGSSALLPAGLGFRNVLINGDFKVWQRGTSTAFTATASTSFLADRWSGYRAVAGSTQSRVSSGLTGFQYALRMQRDSGNTATNRIFIGTSFETSAIATFAGKRMALSFYARAGSNFSATSSLFTLNVYSGTGTECNVVHVTPTSMTTDLSTAFTLTTSWQLFTAYYNVPSGVTQHGLQFDFAPTGTAGANDYVDITGVQLEQNYQPTPFEQRPIGTEEALCQRYYIEMDVTVESWADTSGRSMGFKMHFPTTMRVAPTVSSITGVELQANVSSYNVYRQKIKSVEVYAASSGAGAFYIVNGKFSASAEL